VPHPSPQLLGIAQGLAYLHASGVIHGDLKGVRVITGVEANTALARQSSVCGKQLMYKYLTQR